jgi:hypothetical protein
MEMTLFKTNGTGHPTMTATETIKIDDVFLDSSQTTMALAK